MTRDAAIPRLLRRPDRSFFLFGPRGTGKSTWLQQMLPDAFRLDLLDASLFLELSRDPHRLEALIGKKTEMIARFSTVAGEAGAADAERDVRGFALKFYTEEGNWDMVGNNTPVFFVRDPYKFPDFIHTQKRHPRTNLRSATAMWDFWSLSPESLHQATILMSDRGLPIGVRHINGYGSHTYSFINAKDERFWVKFHFKTLHGHKHWTNAEADTATLCLGP